MRTLAQLCFLSLTLIGVYAVGGNAERWCPFGGVETLWCYLREGNLICSLAISNLYLLGGVLLTCLLVRRAFCSYVCPVGTLSEWMSKAGRFLGVPHVRVAGRLDLWLSLLKYVVLAAVLFFTWRAGELVFRGFDPCYALISRHGEDITWWAYAISGVIVAGSCAVSIPFCRWLCPLAALLNPFSRFGVGRVRRAEASCIACGQCAEACAMAIPVDEHVQIKHARCTSCLACVDACPERDQQAITWEVLPRNARTSSQGATADKPTPVPFTPRRARSAIVFVLLVAVTGAVASSVLIPLPSFVWTRGDIPAETGLARFQVSELSCRGRANLLVYYLTRDDELQIPGYLKLEAWPGPGYATAQVTFDANHVDETVIKMAITEPIFDPIQSVWRVPPFAIEGYDPLAPR